MGVKITRLKQRRNFDANRKVCMNCSREYNEKENFNWSCCTHRSDWGGTMWWCCGKTKHNAKGCKFQKHLSQREREEEDEGSHDQSTRRTKCYICKESGHAAIDCTRDPNLRTHFDVEEELQRVTNAQAPKKMCGETAALTFNMLEKLTLLSHERTLTGMLTHDDFNYAPYNEHLFNLNLLMDSLAEGSESDAELPDDDHDSSASAKGNEATEGAPDKKNESEPKHEDSTRQNEEATPGENSPTNLEIASSAALQTSGIALKQAGGKFRFKLFNDEQRHLFMAA